MIEFVVISQFNPSGLHLNLNQKCVYLTTVTLRGQACWSVLNRIYWSLVDNVCITFSSSN